MLRTRFTDLLGIDAPILQAAIWPAASPRLVAAVGEAGAIGSIAGVFGSADQLSAEIAEVRKLSDHPFVVNHVVPQLDEEAFEATLAARPAAVSLALGDAGTLIERIHEAGSLAIQQVHTVSQARTAAEHGADVVIAQGSDAGGQGMTASAGTLTLVPQVVDAVEPIPVLAAGGVADGRGLAAVIAAGADGANVGTRFLASDEAASSEAWRQAIVAAESESVVRLEEWASVFPPDPAGYAVVPRVLRTEFVDRLRSDPDPAARAEELRAEVGAAIARRDPSGLVPFTGQTAGMIHETLPAGEIVRRMASGAEHAAGRLRDALEGG